MFKCELLYDGHTPKPEHTYTASLYSSQLLLIQLVKALLHARCGAEQWEVRLKQRGLNELTGIQVNILLYNPVGVIKIGVCYCGSFKLGWLILSEAISEER